MDNRPAWPHKVSEDLARWIYGHAVTKITHHWRMTSADTSEDWLELHATEGDKKEPVKKMVGTRELLGGSHWHAQDGIFFNPDHARLVQVAGKIQETIRKIDEWERRNEADRAEYDRLKKKFESAA